MTRKQIKKHAAQILSWEKMRQDPNVSDKQRRDAESKIMQLTNMISNLPHGEGFAILMEIDDIIQHQLENEKLQNKEI